MSPLSIVTYYLNNKRKVLPVTGIIALAVLAISSTGALTDSLFEDEKRELAFYDHHSVVFSNQRAGLSDSMIEQLEGHPAVAETVRLVWLSTRTQGIFGSEGRPIYYLSGSDQQPFASRVGWELVDGRWPVPGTNEVALTENILRNRGLKVGDRIGQQADEKDWLDGAWLVVGKFESGRITGGIADLGYFRENFQSDPDLPPELQDRLHILALVPKPGRESDLEEFLESLPNAEVDAFYKSRAEESLAEDLANADMIIWILNAGTIVVLSLALGLLNVIFFMQRANEFGLLAALGYTKRFLTRRTFSESAVTVIIGWGFGILVSHAIYSALNTVLMTPKGLAPLSILTPRVLIFTTPVPITVTVFSVVFVLWQLWRMDPIAIIERRD